VNQAEFNDPRLVAVYDAAFGWGRDDDFFLAVVTEHGAARVLDLGCGTGRLTLGMAAAGHSVTGVDPAAASIEAARRKPGAEQVTWIVGTSTELQGSFDVAVLTSHVAQFLITDEEWDRTFADLSRMLVPGGRLTFDTRDPQDRTWERWNPVDSRRTVAMHDGTVVEMWTEVTAVHDGLVDSVIHYQFPDAEELVSTATLRFRSETQIRGSLQALGFTVETVYGGWGREPVGQGNGELLVIARA
jgi:ubiquinone/menaquinone biosynthesis C-methylase UbiE